MALILGENGSTPGSGTGAGGSQNKLGENYPDALATRQYLAEYSQGQAMG